MILRRFAAALAAIALVLSTMSSASAEGSSKPDNLATPEITTQATATVIRFIERASSTNPQVRHRAWEMFSPEGQTNLFFGKEESFNRLVAGEIAQFGNVTMDSSGVVVEGVLLGLWSTHGLYHVQFILDESYQISNYLIIPGTIVPKGHSHATLRVSLSDDQIKTGNAKRPEKDILVVSIKNTGTYYHSMVIYRLADKQTPEELVAQILSGTADPSNKYMSTTLEPDSENEIGLIDVQAGNYLVVGYDQYSEETLSGLNVQFTITK